MSSDVRPDMRDKGLDTSTNTCAIAGSPMAEDSPARAHEPEAKAAISVECDTAGERARLSGDEDSGDVDGDDGDEAPSQDFVNSILDKCEVQLRRLIFIIP